ncbi:MAG: cytochrome c family protein [Desulfobacterium sp.]|nr:cytochrome c family protein [Desulfobacterium sp.]
MIKNIRLKFKHPIVSWVSCFFLCACALFFAVATPVSVDADDRIYIGSISCKECHEKEYKNYIGFSKKAGSFKSIKVMQQKLTPAEYTECFDCHTTGYGKPGGFVSETETPDLKNAGCEVCHGPGSLHAQSGDPDDIDHELTTEVCTPCHNPDRIKAFNFKPLLYGGTH